MIKCAHVLSFLNSKSEITPNPLLDSSLDMCHWKSFAAPDLFGIFNRECFERFNAKGVPVQIYETVMQTVTGTFLIDFCVTLSCVTTVTDNTFCQCCCFPSCYCMVLQYPVPMSDTPFNVFSLEGFLPTRTLCSRIQELKQAGKPLI